MTGRRLMQGLPVLLLILFIAFHGFQIVAHEDDPQRGGAFAMFATVDIGDTRRVLVTVPGNTAISVEIPGSLTDQRKRLADTPSEESARHLASLLLGLRWDVDGGTAKVGHGVTFERLRVQVVGLDADGRTILRQILTDVVVGPRS